MRRTIRVLPRATAIVIATLASASATAQTYPTKPVRILYGVTIAETVMRLVGPTLGDALGRPVVIEGLLGAAGNIAADRVAKSAPDGYTILATGDAAVTTNVTLFDKLPYDPVKDLAPITMAADSVNILAVHPAVAATTLAELVALAKAQPGKLTYASGGSGTSQHLGGAMLSTMANIDLVHVPYKGAGASMTDLLSGRVSMQFGNISLFLPLVKEGKLRAIAVSSSRRAPSLPDLPTVAESGYPGFEATAWVGLLAPAGTPDAIVRRLHREVANALAQPEIRAKLIDLGFIPVGSAPEAFGEQIRSEIVKKGRVVRETGAKAS